jgi:hypothetical protein
MKKIANIFLTFTVFLIPFLLINTFNYLIISNNINLIPSENITAIYSLGLNYKFLNLNEVLNINFIKNINNSIYFLHTPGDFFHMISSNFINIDKINHQFEILEFYKKLKKLEYLFLFFVALWISILKNYSNYLKNFNIFLLSVFIFCCPIFLNTQTVTFPYYTCMILFIISTSSIILYFEDKIKNKIIILISFIILGFNIGVFYFAALNTIIFLLFFIFIYYQKIIEAKLLEKKISVYFNFLMTFFWPFALINVVTFVIGYVPYDLFKLLFIYFIIFFLSLLITYIFQKYYNYNFLLIINFVIIGFLISTNLLVSHWGSSLKRIINSPEILGYSSEIISDNINLNQYFNSYLYLFILLLFSFLLISKNKNLVNFTRFAYLISLMIISINLIFFWSHLFGLNNFYNYGFQFRYLFPIITLIGFLILFKNIIGRKIYYLGFLLLLFYPIDYFIKLNERSEKYQKFDFELKNIIQIYKKTTNKKISIKCNTEIIYSCLNTNKINNFLKEKNHNKINEYNSKIIWMNESGINSKINNPDILIYYHNQNTNLNVESMYYLNYFYNDVKFNRSFSIYSLQKLSDL